MPKFGERRRGPISDEQPQSPVLPEGQAAPEPSAEQRLAQAEAALYALMNEQAGIETVLYEHQQQRQQWLRDGGELQRVAELAREDDQHRLRHEQIAAQLPAHYTAVHDARLATQQAAWETICPALAAGEAALVAAIENYQTALAEARALHERAHRAGFGEQLRQSRFVTPPIVSNDWTLVAFLAAVQQRRQPPVATMPNWTEPVVNRGPPFSWRHGRQGEDDSAA
jgi:hypothetical protein